MQAFYLITSSQNPDTAELSQFCTQHGLSPHQILSDESGAQINDSTIAWVVTENGGARSDFTVLRHEAREHGFDVNHFQPGQQPKKLLIADMDATIIRGESLDELAALSGKGEEIAAITRRTMAGELDFETGLNMRLSQLEGQPSSLLDVVVKYTVITPGAEILIATMRNLGTDCFLVSGGFTFLTGRIAERLGFTGHHANQLELAEGKLTGRVIPPLLTKSSKAEILKARLAERSLPLSEAVCIGDGANDIDMLSLAGLGIGFEAKPLVKQAIPTQLDVTNLTGVLYLQGLSASTFSV